MAVYLDHCAAAPLHPRAREAMLRLLREEGEAAWANPSSPHGAGRAAAARLREAREAVARALGGDPAGVVFTSGGTEACNLGIEALGARVRRVVTTPVEHPAVRRAVARLAARRGVEVVELPMRAGAVPGPREVAEALGAGPALLAVQAVNHETGDRWPLPAWVRAAREVGALVFVDGCQALGRPGQRPLAALGDAVAVASAKMGGPAGAGALWVRRGIDFDPLLVGGEQERGRRAGTPSVLLAAGFGAACAALAGEGIPEASPLVLGRRLQEGLEALGWVVNAAGAERAAGIVNASLRGWEGAMLVAAFDLEGVRVAAGPACSSGRAEPSPTVAALYPEAPWRARAAVRFSLGPSSRPRDVEVALEAAARIAARRA